MAAPATEILHLSGTGAHDAVPWEFLCTGGRRSGEWTTIHVPSCWEQEGFGTYQYGMGLRDQGEPPPGVADERGHYRRAFRVPSSWRGRVVRLVCDGVMTDAEIRLNGAPVGPVHRGAFYRFKRDLTAGLRWDADNLLEILVSKESSNRSVNEAERRGDYWNFGGIFRPVFLEALPAAHLDRVAIDARADGSLLAEVFPGGALPEGARWVLRLTDLAGNLIGEPVSGPCPADAGRVVIEAAFPGVAAWTAETPQLYRAQFTLETSAGSLHGIAERIGFRTFEVRPGDGLYLNGVKIRLKGVNRHSFRPETGRTLSPEWNRADVELIRSLNMNAVRLSHYPPDPEFLDACDELGLYVLNELAGWHGFYDEATGRELVGEMIRRDVNHPSILFWDNGNETGWNEKIDDEFHRWDPQRRPVLHPLALFGGVETMHYRSYEETREYLAKPDIFLPTEFLHGLYDGGHGAGLWDYWELMRSHPRCAGGFLWVLADEGVARTDQDGRVDNQGSWAPDGIVGPHHEKLGSVNTVREVWSPVHVGPAQLPPDFAGELVVENRYDFIPLERCRFEWALLRFPGALERRSGHTVLAGGSVPGPAVAPQQAGRLRLPLPADWRDADALHVTAHDPAGRALWTWSWGWRGGEEHFRAPAVVRAPTATRREGNALVAAAGALELRFNTITGELLGVREGGHWLPFGAGPRFIALRRGDRRADGTVIPDVPRGVDHLYGDVSGASRLGQLAARRDAGDLVVEADYAGPLRRAVWRIAPDGAVRLDYAYEFEGVVDLMGVRFDYPEHRMRAIRWLGRGPFRVWQNRLHGTVLDVWENHYNDVVPGETYAEPEFKGFFHDWRWAEFTTAEGRFALANGTPGSFLGVYTPRDGEDALLYTFPPTGLAVLDVIPPVRNKVNATELIGPSAQPHHARGRREGTVHFRFRPA